MIPADSYDAFRDTLLKGGYNLLLGAGVSLDSQNGLGENLRGAEALRTDLCKLVGVEATTNLQRVYSLLDDKARQAELVDRFSRCTPGASLTSLTHYLWRRLFTFNIDDALESLYGMATNAKQELLPRNFDAPFEPTPERRNLLAIHLHGWVREPEKGFVFSYPEYARVMSTMNPWMHLLAEILATEPFIIAGTSLNEVDLEYYLSYRSDATPRRSRGPSLLIEPYPDAATESDCKRYGLTLVRGTFGEFLTWLRSQFPAPPTVTDLVVPDTAALFPSASPLKLLRLFTDFRAVTASEKPRPTAPTPFLYGQAPGEDELGGHVDIPRTDNGTILNAVERMLGPAGAKAPNLLVVYDDAGTGKTTIARRTAHDLAQRGIPVLVLHTLSRIDPQNATNCFATASSKVVLVVDGVADHAEQLAEIVQDPLARDRLIVLATERTYRREYVELAFAGVPCTKVTLHPLNLSERRQLIELYRQYGLVGTPRALNDPAYYANRLEGDPVAIAACRILNDFRPLNAIVTSLWDEATEKHRMPYLCVALAHHCHGAGLRYSILQSIAGLHHSLSEVFEDAVPLRLAENPEDDEYVVPLNAMIGNRILHHVAEHASESLFQAFLHVSAKLAPHVNRLAIMRRSPEARLAGRLFDADKIVLPLLGGRAGELYVSCQDDWDWNSRYWEQRALLTAETDLETALRYARHALAIEKHPYTLTTLSKLILRQMEVDPDGVVSQFEEAFEKLSEAIRMEDRRSRITVHPYCTLFGGAARYMEIGGVLSPSQRASLNTYTDDARSRFPQDSVLMASLRRLDSFLA